MRYMIMFRADGDTEADPACIVQPEMGRFIQQLRGEGVLLASEGLKQSDTGAARVRFSTGGKVSVTDGPFAEAKELIAGFALVQVPSKEEAVELARQFLRIAGEGTAAEVREVMEVH